MTGRNIYMQEDLLERTLQAYSLRNEVIQNNIANNDTPYFKKSVVYFEDTLKDALSSYRVTGKMDMSGVVPTVSVTNKNLSTRMDGNNVDIETENVDLYRNATLLDAISNSVIANYKMLNTVIKS